MKSSRLFRAFQPFKEAIASIMASALLVTSPGFAQTAATEPAATATDSSTAAAPAAGEPEEFAPKVSAEEAGYRKLEIDQLEQLVAPVALYPDELLAQMLPASTTPLDVVAAHQFLESEPEFKEPPAEAVETWDPAVVSLLQFKDVLAVMAKDVSWTISLGEAFYYQESDVYDAIQLVRTKADARGLLADNEQQVYVKETEIIRIEPADPKVIHVPKYEPQVIYVQQQPAPAPKASPDPFLTFAAGVAVVWGLSWAFDWGKRKCVHHHHWYKPWHHHRYHRYYGRPYYGGRPPRPPAYRPPVRPPRPPGWRPPAQRPPGYRPPRPTPPPAQLPAYRPGRPGARPPGGDNAWRPPRPPSTRPPQRPGGGRPPLAGPNRPTQLPATRPATPGARPSTPSARPSKPGTRPATPGTRPSTPATRPSKPSTGPSKPATRPSTPSTGPSKPAPRPSAPSTRPGTPAKAPASNFGPSPRPSAPATRNARDRGSSSLNRSSGARPTPSGRTTKRSSFQPNGGSNRAASRGAASGKRRGR